MQQQVGTTGRAIDPDGVSGAAHYNLHPSGVEIYKINEGMSGNMAAAFKYVARRGLKGDAIKDLRKSIEYMSYEIARLTRQSLTSDRVVFANPDFDEHHTNLATKFIIDEPNVLVRRFALLVCARKPAAEYAEDLLVAIRLVNDLITEHQGEGSHV